MTKGLPHEDSHETILTILDHTGARIRLRKAYRGYYFDFLPSSMHRPTQVLYGPSLNDDDMKKLIQGLTDHFASPAQGDFGTEIEFSKN